MYASVRHTFRQLVIMGDTGWRDVSSTIAWSVNWKDAKTLWRITAGTVVRIEFAATAVNASQQSGGGAVGGADNIILQKWGWNENNGRNTSLRSGFWQAGYGYLSPLGGVCGDWYGAITFDRAIAANQQIKGSLEWRAPAAAGPWPTTLPGTATTV